MAGVTGPFAHELLVVFLLLLGLGLAIPPHQGVHQALPGQAYPALDLVRVPVYGQFLALGPVED